MKLEEKNYFSKEASEEYMSVSQFKSFDSCEAKALAEIKGEYTRYDSVALLQGSYVDAYVEGTLDPFIAKHAYISPKNAPQGHINIFTAKGELSSSFEICEKTIKRIEKDKMFMKFLDGQKQIIKTGEIMGVPVKIKIDVLHPKMIVDLKCMRDFEPIWKDHQRVTFIEAWGYDLQGAVYQEIVGGKLPFIIAGVTKEKSPDIGLFSVPQDILDDRLEYFKSKINRFDDIKKGLVEPIRCEKCDYCKRTKVLTDIVDMRELESEL